MREHMGRINRGTTQIPALFNPKNILTNTPE